MLFRTARCVDSGPSALTPEGEGSILSRDSASSAFAPHGIRHGGYLLRRLSKSRGWLSRAGKSGECRNNSSILLRGNTQKGGRMSKQTSSCLFGNYLIAVVVLLVAACSAWCVDPSTASASERLTEDDAIDQGLPDQAPG